MKASEWNRPASMKSSDTVWIAVETEIYVHIDQGYKTNNRWYFSSGELVYCWGTVIGWLPIVFPTWEPDDE